jgi:hypothetical protein
LLRDQGPEEGLRFFQGARLRNLCAQRSNEVLLGGDLSRRGKGTESKDRIFQDRKTTRKIVDEKGADIDGERISVVLPYDPDFGVNEKTSTLLVDRGSAKNMSSFTSKLTKPKQPY